MSSSVIIKAQPAADELYLNYPFRVEVESKIGETINVRFEGGFTSVNIPEITFDSSEYRAGDGPLYRKRTLGLPTFNEVSLQRGRVKVKDSEDDIVAFKRMIQSNALYSGHRYTVTIYHYHPAGEATKIVLNNAILTRLKVDGDLDSMSSDVSIAEMDFTYEYFTIERVTQNVAESLRNVFSLPI